LQNNFMFSLMGITTWKKRSLNF